MDTIEKKTSLKKRFLAFFASLAVLAGGIVAGAQAAGEPGEVIITSDQPGAQLQILDANGNVVVDDIVTTGQPQTFTIPAGEGYKLHEVAPPAGYKLTGDWTFNVVPSHTTSTQVVSPARQLPTSVSVYNDGLPTTGAYHMNDGTPIFCVDASDEYPPRGTYSAQQLNGVNGLSRDQLLRILYVGFAGNAKNYGSQFRAANDYDATTQFWMGTQYAITSYTNPSLAEEYFGKYLGSNRSLANQIKAAANDTSIVVPDGSIAYGYTSPGNQPFVAASFPVVQQTEIYGKAMEISIVHEQTTTPPPPSSEEGKVVINKTDDQGNVLQGAKFQIKNQAGKVVEEFISTGKDEFTLAPGTYVLQEIQAPDGYQIEGDGKYTFEIKAGTVAGTNASVIGTPTKNDFVYGTGAIVVNGSSLAFCVNPQAVFPFEDSDLNVSRPYSVLSENQVDLNAFGSKTKTSKNGGWVNRGNVPANVGLTAAKMEQAKKVLWATYGYASGDTSKDPSGIISSVFGSADFPTAGVYWATEIAIAEISSPGSVNWEAISDGKNYGNVKSLAKALIAAAQGQSAYFAAYGGFSIVYLQSSDPSAQNLITPGSESVELTITNVKKDKPTGEITIDKVDGAGKLLAGAHLQIINEQNKVVEDFVSDGTHMKFRLPVGKYKLHEVSAPAGYDTSPADVEFEVVDDSKHTFTEEKVTPPATLPGPISTTDGAGRFYDQQGHSVLAYCFNDSIYLGNDSHAGSYASYDYTAENVAAFRDYSNKFNLNKRKESGAEAAQGYLRILYAGAEGNAYESDIDWVDKWRATQYAITYYGGTDKWGPKWEANNAAWGGKKWSQWVKDSKYPDKLEAYKNSLLDAFYDSSLDAKMNEVGYNVAIYAGTEGYWQPNIGVTFGSKTKTEKEWQDTNGTVTMFNYRTPTLKTIASNAEIENEDFSIANAGDPAKGPVTVKIRDLVQYENVWGYQEHIIKGQLVLKSTGEVLDTAYTNLITNMGPNGVAFVNFEFTADKALQEKLRDGDSVVAFETMYQPGLSLYKEDHTVMTAEEIKASANPDALFVDAQEEAWHRDINAPSQTVTFPKIGTTATEGGDHVAPAAKDVTIKDVVKFYGLIPGKEYSLDGTLHVKNAEQTSVAARSVKAVDASNATIKDANARTFVANAANGSVTLEFTVDTTDIAGKKLVAFEEVKYKGVTVAVHADINDADQTVEISEKPTIGTTATGNNTGEHAIFAESKVTVIDTVSYTNLTPGKTYTLKGKLVKKSDGKAVVPGETMFTANDSGTGFTVVLFKDIDASELAGESLVAFEYLYRGDLTGQTVDEESDDFITKHEDIEAPSQTVEVKKPDVKTTASDAADGDKTVAIAETVVIKDVVEFSGLIPGKEYSLDGELHVKNAEQTSVAARSVKAVDASNATITDADARTFVANAANGSVTLEFTVDTTDVAGEQVVVFEFLKYQDKEIAPHADINDENQTVDVEEEQPEIEKYVNKKVHHEITLTEVFTYDVLAYITKDADKAVITDTLVDDLQFVSTVDEVTVVDLGEENDHMPVTGTVTKDGTPVNTAKVKIDGQTLTVTIDPATAERGHWVKVTFNAKIKDGLNVSDLTYEQITENTPVLTDEQHEGVPNDASYTIYVDNKGKYYDESNTVTVKPGSPEIRTSAVEKETKARVVSLENSIEDFTIVDTVTWYDLAEGTYVVRGVLMDKNTGEEIKLLDGSNLTGSAEFTVTKEQATAGRGTVDVEFNLNFTDLIAAGYVTQTAGGALPSVTTVVYEKVFAVVNGEESYTPVATHEDIEDEDQTVTFDRKPKPGAQEMSTTATDAADGDKIFEAGTAATVKDVVTYKGLKPGQVHTLRGKLVVKGTGGTEVVATAEKTFTPEAEDGTVEMLFDFNTTGLEGKDLVVYEYLWEGDVLGEDLPADTAVVTHADDNDLGQTVTVRKTTTPPPTPPPFKRVGVKLPVTGLPKTGSAIGVAGLAALLLIGGGLVLVRRRNED